MDISLSPQLAELIRSKVSSGLYGSAGEVVQEALRLLEERDRERALRLANLRAQLEQGLASGEPLPLDLASIKARGRRRLAALQQERPVHHHGSSILFF